jgi:hypothetical protein
LVGCDVPLLAMLLLYLFSTGRKPLEVELRRQLNQPVDGLQDSLCRTPHNAKRNGQSIMAVKDDDFASCENLHNIRVI